MKRLLAPKVLAHGEARCAALMSIDAALDAGGGASVKALEKATLALKASLASYNKTLATAEKERLEVKEGTANVRDLTSRLLSAVAARYGKDSPQYAQAGGKKTSERKRPGKRKKEEADRKRAHHRAPASDTQQAAPPPAPTVGGDSNHGAGVA